MAQPIPQAYLGFVGFVKVNAGTIPGDALVGQESITHDPFIVRATTADINLSQEITLPDVVDSRYDRTVYQLGPKLVDGTLEFPALYEVATGQERTLFEILYRYAVTRQQDGLLAPFTLDVKYATSQPEGQNESEFRYTGCIANTWQFRVAQSDVVTCSIDIIGVDRLDKPKQVLPPARNNTVDCEPIGNTANGQLGTTRIVTWNDARVELIGGSIGSNGIGGQFMRSFECNINNDAERFYTLNTFLFPQAIAPRKREITGNVVLMGRHPVLSNVALDNELRCSESSEIHFGFATQEGGEGCGTQTFNTVIPNTVFQIEEMSLTNDIFETTVQWRGLPAAGTGQCDPIQSRIGSAKFTYENIVNKLQ
jgi:hypothetical protein